MGLVVRPGLGSSLGPGSVCWGPFWAGVCVWAGYPLCSGAGERSDQAQQVGLTTSDRFSFFFLFCFAQQPRICAFWLVKVFSFKFCFPFVRFDINCRLWLWTIGDCVHKHVVFNYFLNETKDTYFYLTVSNEHSNVVMVYELTEKKKKKRKSHISSCIVNLRQFHMHYIKETAISILMYRFLQILLYVCKT